MFRRLLSGLTAQLPSQCAVCHAWPARALCDDCTILMPTREPIVGREAVYLTRPI